MYSKGICWIDDCRIPFVEDINFDYRTTRVKEQTIYGGGRGIPKLNGNPEYNNQGRFPANILVSDDMLNDGVISKSVQSKRGIYAKGYKPGTNWERGTEDTNNIRGHNDKGTNSRYYDIDKWFEKILDV